MSSINYRAPSRAEDKSVITSVIMKKCDLMDDEKSITPTHEANVLMIPQDLYPAPLRRLLGPSVIKGRRNESRIIVCENPAASCSTRAGHGRPHLNANSL